MAECWGNGTATFLILGDTCTRSCGFCDVKRGKPLPLDLEEPQRIAEAVKAMGLKHVVITSVNRDDCEDGGASIFAATILRIRELQLGCTVEALIPDFKGNIDLDKLEGFIKQKGAKNNAHIHFHCASFIAPKL